MKHEFFMVQERTVEITSAPYRDPASNNVNPRARYYDDDGKLVIRSDLSNEDRAVEVLRAFLSIENDLYSETLASKPTINRLTSALFGAGARIKVITYDDDPVPF